MKNLILFLVVGVVLVATSALARTNCRVEMPLPGLFIPVCEDVRHEVRFTRHQDYNRHRDYRHSRYDRRHRDYRHGRYDRGHRDWNRHNRYGRYDQHKRPRYDNDRFNRPYNRNRW
jgi:hypothetical protein